MEWIKVSDRLPEEPDNVLVSLESGWVTLMGAYYKSGWTAFYANGQKKVSVNEVTHWMPLPEPPKK